MVEITLSVNHIYNHLGDEPTVTVEGRFASSSSDMLVKEEEKVKNDDHEQSNYHSWNARHMYNHLRVTTAYPKKYIQGCRT